MSVICDVLVYSTTDSDEAAASVAFARPGVDWTTGLRAIGTDGAGGSKVFCGYVYAAALNHVTPDEIIAAVVAADWPDPDHTIIVMDPYDYDIEPYATTVTEARA